MDFHGDLKATFDSQAENYVKMRPGYVPALYEDIFKAINLDQNSKVIEIGIGGGQATLPILKTGCKLTAVEYGKNLAEICREKFKEYPDFSVVVGKFEEAELEEEAWDLIFSATAFHWIPEEIGYPKVFRLLKKGGVFARFANHPHRDMRDDLNKEIQKLYDLYMPNPHAPEEYEEEEALRKGKISEKYGFTQVSCGVYHRIRRFTSEEYIQLLGTYSDHIALEEGVRNRFFAEIRSVIDAFGGEMTLYDTMDLQLARKP